MHIYSIIVFQTRYTKLERYDQHVSEYTEPESNLRIVDLKYSFLPIVT